MLTTMGCKTFISMGSLINPGTLCISMVSFLIAIDLSIPPLEFASLARTMHLQSPQVFRCERASPLHTKRARHTAYPRHWHVDTQTHPIVAPDQLGLSSVADSRCECSCKLQRKGNQLAHRHLLHV